MHFQLPQLPFSKDAFEGKLASRETFDFHYDKHHKAYVDKMNTLLEKEGQAGKNLEDLVMSSQGALFNNAGQAWNHTFFWHCMSPEQRNPSDRLGQALQSSFGDLDSFKKEFVEAGKSQFGSGWVWLVKDPQGKLSVVSTSNAENPARDGKLPLLVADVWEHAYYIDYRNDRGTFLEKFLGFVNWDFVARNLESDELANMTEVMLPESSSGAGLSSRRSPSSPDGSDASAASRS